MYLVASTCCQRGDKHAYKAALDAYHALSSLEGQLHNHTPLRHVDPQPFPRVIGSSRSFKRGLILYEALLNSDREAAEADL